MTIPSSSPTPAPSWSSETRTWVSLALFVHLFAVVVAVTTYTRPSGLQERLHQLFEPYLRNLNLTPFPVSYPFARFHLTHTSTSDVDFTVEVTGPNSPDANAATLLPPAGVRPLVRWRRYQALANAAGTLASGESDAFVGILPKAIAGSILREQNATRGTIRIQALGLPDEDSLPTLEAVLQAAKNNRTDVYKAQVLITPNSTELVRESATLEVAPAEGPAPKAPRPASPGPRGARP